MVFLRFDCLPLTIFNFRIQIALRERERDQRRGIDKVGGRGCMENGTRATSGYNES